jgi:hypothetical protein
MRLVLVVIALFVAGAVVVGCGDDDKSSDNTSASTPTTDTGGSGGDTSTEETGGSGGGNADNPQVQQAIEACKQQIDAQPGLDAPLKEDLKQICEKAATGDEQAVRDASKEVCTKIVEANVPDGPAREQALAACDQAGATP